MNFCNTHKEMASGLEAISYWILFSSDVAPGLFDCCGIGCAFTASARIEPAVKSPAVVAPIRRRGMNEIEFNFTSAIIEPAIETVVVQTIVRDCHRCALLDEVDIDNSIVYFPRDRRDRSLISL